jgi:hypothetical protein
VRTEFTVRSSFPAQVDDWSAEGESAHFAGVLDSAVACYRLDLAKLASPGETCFAEFRDFAGAAASRTTRRKQACALQTGLLNLMIDRFA